MSSVDGTARRDSGPPSSRRSNSVRRSAYERGRQSLSPTAEDVEQGDVNGEIGATQRAAAAGPALQAVEGHAGAVVEDGDDAALVRSDLDPSEHLGLEGCQWRAVANCRST
ncbi:hypothetical protein ACIBJF_42510 [Streptomyces sp. NPDC050743]|uniref:hypothetical protein n=1 Tax=Streptomyces sp. NPDC050743 TaxID=3365634 RepID=UPI0037AFC340